MVRGAALGRKADYGAACELPRGGGADSCDFHPFWLVEGRSPKKVYEYIFLVIRNLVIKVTYSSDAGGRIQRPSHRNSLDFRDR